MGKPVGLWGVEAELDNGSYDSAGRVDIDRNELCDDRALSPG
jgi:hypothetical protein